MLAAFGALAITLGLIFLALPLLRRLQEARAGAHRSLELIERIATGPKQGIGLLRVADRVLVVSLGERGATLLAELDDDERDVILAPRPDSARHPERTEGAEALTWLRCLRALRALRVTTVLVLLLPSWLAAQAPTARQQARLDSAKAAQAAQGNTGVRAAPSSRTIPIAPISPAPARRPPVAAPAPQVQGPQVLGPESPRIDFRIGEGDEQVRLSGSVGLVVFMGALTLLPAMFLLMTSFTRILIVLHFLRSALGTQTTPPGQLLVALAVLLTGVVMHPVLERANTDAFRPYMDGRITQAQAYGQGLVPFREFMLANTREQDLAAFAEMSGTEDADSLEALPTVTIVSAFVTSELRTAFQMGFVIFLPFIVVDLIVASVLMSMGMFMLPPAMVSLPFKLLLFVLADGWTLVIRNLLASFQGVPS